MGLNDTPFSLWSLLNRDQVSKWLLKPGVDVELQNAIEINIKVKRESTLCVHHIDYKLLLYLEWKWNLELMYSESQTQNSNRWIYTRESLQAVTIRRGCALIYPVSACLLSIQLPVSMTTGKKASIVPARNAHFGHLKLYLFAEVKPLLLKKGGLETWWVLPSSIPRLRQSFRKLSHRSACCRSQWKAHHSVVMYVWDSL